MRRMTACSGPRQLLLPMLLVTVGAFNALPSRAALPEPASHDWFEVRTPRFQIMGDVEPHQLEQTALHLERMVRFFDVVMPGISADTTLVLPVYLFKSSAGFEAYRPNKPPGAGKLVGYHHFGSSGELIAMLGDDPEESRQYISHEYMHSVLRHSFGWLPPWVNEGLAEYFSTIDFTEHSVKLGGPISWSVQSLRRGFAPMCEFIAVDYDSPEYTGEGAGPFYAQSWGIMHALMTSGLHGDSRTDELLQELSHGVASSRALAKVFGATACDSLGNVLRYYATNLQFTVKLFKSPTLQFDLRIPSAHSLDRAGTLTQLGVLMAKNGGLGLPSAKEHLLAAVAEDSTAASALGWLAAVSFRLNDGEATVWTQREQRHAGSAPAGVALAMAIVARAVGDGLPSHWPPPGASPELLQARAVLEQALVVEPRQPDLLEAYTTTFLTDAHADPAALGALLVAEEIRPRRSVLMGMEAVLAAHEHRLGAALHHTARIPNVPDNEWWKRAATNVTLGLASDSLHSLVRAARWGAADSLVALVERGMPRGDHGWAKQTRARLKELKPVATPKQR